MATLQFQVGVLMIGAGMGFEFMCFNVLVVDILGSFERQFSKERIGFIVG